MKIIILLFVLEGLILLVNNSGMSLRDKGICQSCLDIIKQLRVIKNSSVCDENKFVGGNKGNYGKQYGNFDFIPQSELMCYELYYYFFYFKPDFFYDEQITSFKSDKKQSECEVCSYLDKCEFYECVSGLDNILEENNKKEKQKEFEKNVKNVKFVQNNKKQDSINPPLPNNNQINIPLNINLSDLQPDFIADHFSIIKTKIEHILDELINLGNIHDSARKIKKNLINLFIVNKLKAENKLDKDNSILKINSKEGNIPGKNYVDRINLISEKFMELFDAYEQKIDETGEGLMQGEDFNSEAKKKKAEMSIKYLTSFLQAYNELFRLGKKIHNSNSKIISSIMNDFTQDKIMLKNQNKTANILKSDTYVKQNKTKVEKIGRNLKITSTKQKVGNFTQISNHSISNTSTPKVSPKNPLNNTISNSNNIRNLKEFKFLIEKISKMEKEQERMKMLLHEIGNNTISNKVETNSKLLDHINNNTLSTLPIPNLTLPVLSPDNHTTQHKIKKHKPIYTPPDQTLLDQSSELTDASARVSNQLILKKKKNSRLRKIRNFMRKLDKY